MRILKLSLKKQLYFIRFFFCLIIWNNSNFKVNSNNICIKIQFCVWLKLLINERRMESGYQLSQSYCSVIENIRRYSNSKFWCFFPCNYELAALLCPSYFLFFILLSYGRLRPLRLWIVSFVLFYSSL